MWEDFVGFGGYNVSSQGFALVNTVSEGLLTGNISGLMGKLIAPLCLFCVDLSTCRIGISKSRSLRCNAFLAKSLPSRSSPLPGIRIPINSIRQHDLRRLLRLNL